MTLLPDVMAPLELTAVVAGNAAVSTSLGVGATAAVAAGAGQAAVGAVVGGEAAGEAATVGCGAAVLEAMGPVGVVLGLAGIVAWPMAHGEAVKVDIENVSGSTITEKDLYIHHGKKTAYPVDGKIPVTTKEQSDVQKSMHSMYAFAKKSAAFYGTEGALILEVGNSKTFISIAWYIPQNGSNACAVSFDYEEGKKAWEKLIDNGKPGRTSTAKKDCLTVSAALDSTSGGDRALLVEIIKK